LRRRDLDPHDIRCSPLPRLCPGRIGARRTWRDLLVSKDMRRRDQGLARRIEGMEDVRHAEVWAGRRISVDGRVLGRKRASAQLMYDTKIQRQRLSCEDHITSLKVRASSHGIKLANQTKSKSVRFRFTSPL
jgi:hypothetical protein